MKLTFAKAEHLKKNAAAAEDPKAVFQAMRTVFNDLVTEIQRSIGYFTSINRSAKIGGMVALGNAMKLPGLRRYLAQALGFEVERVESFVGLTGAEVASVPAFKENAGAFGVAYGLAVQALGRSALQTNLLPPELVQQRMIRNKKPWAVAAAAVLLLGCTLNFVGHQRVLATVENPTWSDAESKAESVESYSSGLKSKQSAAQSEFSGISDIATSLTGNVEGRLVWLELLTAINQCLPADPADQKPEDIQQRNELHVEAIDCQRVDDPSEWFGKMKENDWYWKPPAGEADLNDLRKGIVSIPQATDQEEGAEEEADAELTVEEGRDYWIVQLTGYHYHNFEDAGETQGAQYVRNTLIRNLHNKIVQLPKATIQEGATEDSPIVILPSGDNVEPEEVSMEELGVFGATLVNPEIVKEVQVRNPAAKISMYDIAEGKPGMPGAPMSGRPGTTQPAAAQPAKAPADSDADAGEEAEEAVEPYIPLRRFDFVVQFAWVVTPPMKRAEIKAEKARLAEEAAEAAAAEAAQAAEGDMAEGGTTDTTTPPADTTTPPAGTATPPAGTTTPPADTATPPADTTSPPADTTTPPADTTTPPADTTTPPADTTTPPPAATTTPPASPAPAADTETPAPAPPAQ